MGKKEDLVEKLSNLDDKKLEKLLNLLEDPQKKEKRKQSRKSKKTVDKRSSPRRIKLEGSHQKQDIRRGRSSSGHLSGAASIAQPMYIGPRENKFLNMGLENANKNDTKLQKKLSGDYQFIERRNEVQLLEVECNRCNYIYEGVHPSIVIKDDTGNYFTCDKCQNNRRE